MRSVFDAFFSFFGRLPTNVAAAMADAGTAKAAGLALLGTLGTALLGLAGSIGVALGRALVRWFRSKVDHHIVNQAIQIDTIKLDTASVSEVRACCLLVRYGTDLYFEKLASDQEKYEGRLQNRVLRNRSIIRWRFDRRDRFSLFKGLRYAWFRLRRWNVVEEDAEWLTPVFKLPVHSRLGTQFKFFLEVVERGPRSKGVMMKVTDKNAEAEKRERYFRVKLGSPASQDSELLVTLGENAEAAARVASAPSAESVINNGSRAFHIAREIAEQLGLSEQDIVRRFKPGLFGRSTICYRLWFALADFPRVRTADGLENNMAFPI